MNQIYCKKVFALASAVFSIAIVELKAEAISCTSADPLMCILNGMDSCRPFRSNQEKSFACMEKTYRACTGETQLKSSSFCVINGMTACVFEDNRNKLENCMDDVYTGCLSEF